MAALFRQSCIALLIFTENLPRTFFGIPGCSRKLESFASGTKRFRRLHGPGLSLSRFSLQPGARAVRPRPDAALRQDFSGDAGKILCRRPAQLDRGGEGTWVSRR